jgi:hypothetical protein
MRAVQDVLERLGVRNYEAILLENSELVEGRSRRTHPKAPFQKVNWSVHFEPFEFLFAVRGRKQ